MPNSNEVQNYIILLLVSLGSGWAAANGVDKVTLTSIVSGAVALVGVVWSLARHHNSKLVDENAPAAPRSNPSAMAGVRSLIFIGGISGLLCLTLSHAKAADLPTKAPALPSALSTYELPCTPQQCIGLYVGGTVGGIGGNADVVGNGLSNSIFAGGGYLGAQFGAQYWNGVVFGAAEFGFGGEFNANNTVNGVQTNNNGLFAYQIAKFGGSLSGILGVTPAPPPNFPTITAQMIAPYALAGAVERSFGTGWTTGGGVEFAVASHSFVDLKYMYVNYGGGSNPSPTLTLKNENLILASWNYKF